MFNGPSTFCTTLTVDLNSNTRPRFTNTVLFWHNWNVPGCFRVCVELDACVYSPSSTQKITIQTTQIHILKCPERKTHFGYCLKFRKHRWSSWPFCYNEMVWERCTSNWREQRNSHPALVRCHFHHPTQPVTGSSFGPVPAPACHSQRWAIDLSMAVAWGEAAEASLWWENATQQIKRCYCLTISQCLQTENEINKPLLSCHHMYRYT